MTLDDGLFGPRPGPIRLGGVDVERLLGCETTPFYVLDLDRVRRRLDALRTLGGTPFYAVKANANVELIRRLAGFGLGVDVCSEGDMAFAAAAGVPTDRWSYTSPCMTSSELRLVARTGAFLVADSVRQLEQYGGLVAAGTPVGIRVNTGIRAGFHPAVMASAPTSKFGVPRAELDHAVEAARGSGLVVTVMHGHLGSDLLDLAPHVALLDALLGAAARIPSVTSVDIGGGWGVPFSGGDDEYDMVKFAEIVRDRLDDFRARHDRPIDLRLEPGTYIVRDAGYLVTRVVAVNRRGTSVQIGTDTSSNHLPGSLLFGTQHPAAATRTAPGGTAPRAMVVGNLLLGGDVLLRDAPFGHLQPGDAIVFGLSGAYTAVRATTFNGRPRPAELLVEGGFVTRARRAETVEDLLAQQCCTAIDVKSRGSTASPSAASADPR